MYMSVENGPNTYFPHVNFGFSFPKINQIF